jgi:hypothetical protein
LVAGQYLVILTYEDKDSIMTYYLGFSVVRLLAPLLLLASTFPYFQIVPNSGYTQPQAYALGLILFFFSIKKYSHLIQFGPLSIFSLGIVGLSMYIITTFPYNNLQEYRYLLVYLSPLLMIPVFITTIQKAPRTTVRILQISIVVWLIVSIIQFIVNPQFATSLIGRRADIALDIALSGRGVLGLAPEPTHNGFHVLLLGAALSLLDSSRFSRLLVFGCCISAIFLASSSSALLAFSLASFIWIFRFKPILGIISTIVGMFLLQYSPLAFQEFLGGENRILALLRAFLENPSTFLLADYSVNVRLGGLWATMVDSVQSGLLPNGLAHHTWLVRRADILKTHEWLFDISLTGPPSGFGMLLFQGGFLVIPFIFVFIHTLLRNLPVTPLGQVVVMAIPFIFLSQFYISAPLFSLVYACILNRKSLKKLTRYRTLPSEFEQRS